MYIFHCIWLFPKMQTQELVLDQAFTPETIDSDSNDMHRKEDPNELAAREIERLLEFASRTNRRPAGYNAPRLNVAPNLVLPDPVMYNRMKKGSMGPRRQENK